MPALSVLELVDRARSSGGQFNPLAMLIGTYASTRRMPPMTAVPGTPNCISGHPLHALTQCLPMPLTLGDMLGVGALAMPGVYVRMGFVPATLLLSLFAALAVYSGA